MAVKQKILIVDDDENIAELISLYLTKECFETKIVYDGESALEQVNIFKPDLILLDLMLPGIDGYQVCREIRKTNNIPIIMLSAKGETFDKVLGLELGADDYMIKPYSLRELSARIQVLIRRYQKTSVVSAAVLEYPPLRLELNVRKAFYENEEIPLTNKEYDLLHLLAASPNTVFTFEDIGQAIWGQYIESDRKTIMVTVNRLRKKLSDYPALCHSLETVWSKGYQFIVK